MIASALVCLALSVAPAQELGLWSGDKGLVAPHEGGWRITVRGPAGDRAVKPGGAGLSAATRTIDGGFETRWKEAAGLEVVLAIKRSNTGDTCEAHLAVVALPPGESLREIAFPSVRLGPIGAPDDDILFYPNVAGRLRKRPHDPAFSIQGTYPGGWWSMQFCALHDGAASAYVGVEDPTAATKDLIFKGATEGVRFETVWPAPDCGKPGNTWSMPGRVRLARFSGDWFDAARLYRSWAIDRAPWLRERRRASPPWTGDVAVWALASGSAGDVVGPVKEFAAFMGVPAAVHWYNWHQIPFDTDYPHYFPAKPGFAVGVKALQAAGVRVMPYINGRLWDTGLSDFAGDVRGAATKDEKGEPYIEEYGSGRKLAPMCPATPLWQAKVQEIVSRLLAHDAEYGLDAVYIDQIAAAQPRLCFDPGHGHPLAGGSWWIDAGYRPMLERLRAAIAPDRVLTTECNAEPYIDLLDAYLTWHFQYPDSVPAFAAVYGGRIQLFGRAYRGGPTADLALRMKAAQSLVWGEQIGWIGPEVIKHETNGPFVRRMARLRSRLRDFLAFGEMARPPRFVDPPPDVTADWQWSGTWPVTGPAVEAGAWRSRDGRIALIFINLIGDRRKLALELKPELWDLKPGSLAARRITEEAERDETPLQTPGRPAVELEPYGAWAWIVR